MKIKATRCCAFKGCDKQFKLFKTTDKYCPEHNYQVNMEKLKNKTKKPYKLKPMSEKRKRDSLVYRDKRKTFLSLPENKYCRVAKEVFNEYLKTDQVHHMKGRTGKLYLYVPYWLAVSDKGHKWIHANPTKAYELGFLISSTSK